MQCLDLVIHGRVQGVGFRWFVRQRALELGVAGSVRNLPDGSVGIEAEGEREQLERLVEAVRIGPRGAHVQSVDTTWAERAPRHRAFTITA